MKYTNKKFQNIISQAWLNTSEQDVRKLVEAVKEDLMNGMEYTRSNQLNVLSRLYMKETDSAQREIIYQAQETLMELVEQEDN